MSKYKIAASLAALCGLVTRLLGNIEEKAYRGTTTVKHTALAYGTLESQAKVNRAIADVERARMVLEEANTHAKLQLRAHPERLAAIRAEVFG